MLLSSRSSVPLASETLLRPALVEGCRGGRRGASLKGTLRRLSVKTLKKALKTLKKLESHLNRISIADSRARFHLLHVQLDVQLPADVLRRNMNWDRFIVSAA